MSFGLQEIRQSCIASWRIMKGESEALQQFDLSADGFWRSFLVVFVLLPFYFLGLLAEQSLLLETHLAKGQEAAEFISDGSPLYLGKSLALFVDWITFPIVVGFLSASIGLRKNYGPYIIVRNWSTLIILLPQTLVNLLYLSGLIPSALLVMLTLPIVGWVLWYRFQIARVAGGCKFSIAVGLVVLDLVLSILISTSFDRLFAA
ncbi:hypothetical protein PsAD2_00032 [Pseudovibrio axinellae]|uniref:Yip1 domain protein n=1 Tax=Pseudovibrio axinellae TaxID=989403 RepID=A0A166B881_9HYPH|nr:hypothetical protein [Pseudovibrio axinellae]KZL22007.1 hypothetical protein PsAD2_00032 [Pseudovibrio axinellae]SEQ58977.1 hypothetical protein SAMN05421798_103168 [Pseudovibrio axinellae]